MLAARSRVCRARATAWAQSLTAGRPSARCLSFLKRADLFKINSRQADAHLFQYSHLGDPSHISREGSNTSSPQLIHSQLSLTGSCMTLSPS